MVLSYYYLAHEKGLLQAHHDRFCSLVKLFCTYFCYLNLLTIFFSQNYVSLERSPLDKEEKCIKPLKKWKCQKCQWLTHFLTNKYIYVINLLLKSGLTVAIFLLMRKTCKIVVRQHRFHLFNHTTLLFFLFKVNF